MGDLAPARDETTAFVSQSRARGKAEASLARSASIRKLLCVLGVALAIRLIVVSYELPMQLNPARDHFQFGWEMGRVARSITLGQGFSNPFHGETGPTALLPPVYPYLLAGVFKLFGIYTKASAIAILFLNGLFSGLTCLPIYYAARRSFNPKVALGAAWAWALFPHAIYLSADVIWDQCLTALVLALLFLVALHLEQSANSWAWVGFGLLCGLAALTNPTVLSVLPFLGGWICYRLYRQGKGWLLPACAAGFMLILSLTPWVVRNYRTFHQLIPLRDGFWLEVYFGNTGDTSNFRPVWAHPGKSESEWEEYRRTGELAYIAGKRQQAIEFIRTHPRWFALATLRRICFLWTGVGRLPGIDKTSFDPGEPRVLNILAYTTLTVLTLFGLQRAIRERNAAAVPYAIVLFTLPLVYYFTHPELRYRHPMDPEAVILAAYAVGGRFTRNLSSFQV